MARELKNYHERKNEFLDTAQQLFFTQGYEQTSVEMIIRKMGLSKGTFYYYFTSKEELLDKLTCRMGEKILKEVKRIANREDLDAVAKLNKAYAAAGSVKLKNIKLLKVLLKTLYDDKNIFFRHKMFMNSIEILVPEFSKIIRQGVNEKVFNTPFPGESARLIFTIGYALFDKVPQLIMDLDKNPENLNKVEKEYRVYENAIERIIGAEEGTAEIVNRDILKKFS
ncbi:MAG: TetR/AcrR family transcriptional regulator, partial [Candidatus Caldatribacteriota bacterium]|nr:TetR/AcrR family transcriptional regulator [Candidatus Caldatribacteriota bacterium]